MEISEILDNIKGRAQRAQRLGKLSDSFTGVDYWIPTGMPTLDICLNGGIPGGRFVEIYGDASTGKSLLSCSILSQCQAMGGIAALLDTEAGSSEEFMQRIGLDTDNLIYSVPDTIEQVFDDLIGIINARNSVDKDLPLCVVWDSVAATSSEEELEKILSDGLAANTVATHARQISKMLRNINSYLTRENCTFIAINQTREKIGVLFGDNETTFGGRAIEYYAALRIKISKVRQIKNADGDKIGIDARAYVSKSKVGSPFMKCEFPIMFQTGLNVPIGVLWWLRKNEKISGRGWKTLEIDGNELKFQNDEQWSSIFYENYDAILGMLK